MKKMSQTKKEKNNGITLIALVITIIVLLILAAVSIATLTGENGILSQATKAREETKKSDVIEMAKTDILGYQVENKNGEITIGQLKNVLSTYFKDIPEEEELKEKLKEKDFKLTTKPKYGEQEIEISEIYKGSSVEETEWLVAAKKINEHIGQVVNYTDNSNGKVKDWRIFYANGEKKEMFLITSNTISTTNVFGSKGIPLAPKGKYNETESGKDYSYSDESDKYTGAEDVFATTYGATYNEMWKHKKSTANDEKSKSTAYLCDSNNWTEYVGNNAPDGTYAVGGPTKELFIKSWNASIPQTKVKSASLANEDVTVDGYAYDKPSDLYNGNPILKSILPKTENGEDGLYNNGISYWIASPSKYDANSVCIMYREGSMNHSGYWGNDIAVRPLVSIPIDKVQVEENGEISIIYN